MDRDSHMNHSFLKKRPNAKKSTKHTCNLEHFVIRRQEHGEESLAQQDTFLLVLHKREMCFPISL